ncbi:LAFA_0E08372g1_1 [Lachancea sp. 'fantastica']|nr:LAFA_0E08372g1_1 [Lachancea sp. 'fantastica']
MSTNPFDEAVKNPDFKIQPVNDDIDVADISSDEDAKPVVNVKQHASEVVQSEPSNQASTKPSNVGEQTIEASEQSHDNGSTIISVEKDSKTPALESSSGDSSAESEDSSSDESSSDSSSEQVPVMDDDDGEDDDAAPQGPITSKNELTEEPVFEIPENFELAPNALINEIGVIKSAFDHNIIIQSCSSAEQRVLKENSLLCLQDRQVLGPLCEVFGPLQAPFYRVTFPKSKTELYEKFSQLKGQKVFYVAPEAHWHDTFELKRMRGTDASNGFDEELPEEEQEFSDDEKEAMHKKSKKQSKKQRVDGADGATNNKSFANKFSSRQKVKGDGLVAEKGAGSAVSSYRSRSARHGEPPAPEARSVNPTPYENRSSQNERATQYQEPHHLRQQREREYVPQEFQNFHSRPQIQSPYSQQQPYNYPFQEYQRTSDQQYPGQGYTSQYNHHHLQSPSSSPYPQTFVGASYPGQHHTQPLGSYAPAQPLNAAYHPANAAYNSQFAQPQMVPQPGSSQAQMAQMVQQPGAPQPQMMPPQGYPQPQSQNMQQVWQLQQILMDQQKQHQNNQHNNGQL